jgi:hypothetical protein
LTEASPRNQRAIGYSNPNGNPVATSQGEILSCPKATENFSFVDILFAIEHFSCGMSIPSSY